MFLNQQKKTQILESSDLQTLLKAINNSEVLTESEISTVTNIENVIKEDTKLVLSEEAEYEYYKFLEKVILLDDSLNEGVIDSIKTIGRVIKNIFGNQYHDPMEEDRKYFNNKYKTNYNSFSPSNINKIVDDVLKDSTEKDKTILKGIINNIVSESKKEMVGSNKELKSEFNKELELYKKALTKLYDIKTS